MNRIYSLLLFGFVLFGQSPMYVNAANSICNDLSPKIKLLESRSLTVFTGQPTYITLGDNLPEMTEWYLDGMNIYSAEGSDYCLMLPTVGHHTLEVRRAFNNYLISTPLEVVSYPNIQIGTIIPKAGDGMPESFTLINRNLFTVHLKNWSLRSLTSSIRIPINSDIEPSGNAWISTNNRLNNVRGEYGLYNESDQLIDVVKYSMAEAGEVIHRDGIFWSHSTLNTTTPDTQNNQQNNIDTFGEISGIVTLPSGRTIDIKTNTGESVRIVLHPSFKGEKPRLHRGDKVSATGIWKRSKRGWYLSVRDGYTFTVLYELNRRISQKKTSIFLTKAHNQLLAEPKLISSAERKFIPLVLGDMNQSLTTPFSQWLMLTLITLVSAGMTLPFHREKFV